MLDNAMKKAGIPGILKVHGILVMKRNEFVLFPFLLILYKNKPIIMYLNTQYSTQIKSMNVII